MDVVVIGGGPGGLYFAALHKRDHPADRVRVFERNRPDDTFGFGVAFQELTLRNLAEADPVSQTRLLELLQPWDNFYFHVRGVHHRISDITFGGCSRRKLLALLQGRAEEVGVELSFEHPAAPSDFPDADLVVVADGSGSRTRAALADDFGATVVNRPNRFVWLGTTLEMDALNFFFNEQPEGIFVAHSYPHEVGQGTWIVEVTGETFERLGIDEADEAATVALVTRVFEDELQGHPVIARSSWWRRFPLVTCERWVSGNVVLLGDAKGTVHFSIGSGTKIAMEDSVALQRALARAADVPTALADYEVERRGAFDHLRSVAFGSMIWFEHLDAHWPTDPAQMIFAAATRKTTETYRTLDERVPDLVAAADAAVAGARRGDDVLTASFAIGDLVVPNRVVGRFGDAPADGIPAPGLVVVEADEGDIATAVGRARRDHDGPIAVVVSGDDDGGWRGPDGGEPELLVVDLSTTDLAGATGAGVAAVAAVRAALPADRLVGVRVTCPDEPADALEAIGSLVRAGVALVDVSGSGTKAGLFDHQVLLADLVRHRFGVPTVCGGLMSRDDAQTVLASARADLVMVVR